MTFTTVQEIERLVKLMRPIYAGGGSMAESAMDMLNQIAEAMKEDEGAKGEAVDVDLLKRLMICSTKLGISHTCSIEEFRARLPDELYAICREIQSDPIASVSVTDASSVERLARHIALKESRNCKTLEDSIHHQSNWRRLLPEAREMLEASAPSDEARDALIVRLRDFFEQINNDSDGDNYQNLSCDALDEIDAAMQRGNGDE